MLNEFFAFLNACCTFTRMNYGLCYFTFAKDFAMSTEAGTFTLSCWFSSTKLLKRWKIKRWFKKIYRSNKFSFPGVFREIPLHLEFIESEGTRYVCGARIIFLESKYVFYASETKPIDKDPFELIGCTNPVFLRAKKIVREAQK